MRGEQKVITHGDAPAFGSSPRAWGTGHDLQDQPCVRRFIPTCVGNRHSRFRGRSVEPVHPHVRGEQPQLCGGELRCVGSSPRAWGTACSLVPWPEHERFIPTCVGNSLDHAAALIARSVHPHVRGEQQPSRPDRRHHYGSSPRAWGTEHYRAGRPWRGRFIPTCVGNSPEVTWHSMPGAVHPHVRGEQYCPER